MGKHVNTGVRNIAVLLLIAAFFLLAMGITLFGSSVYRGVVAASSRNYTHRTALSYLANQIRRCDIRGGVAVGSFEGYDALILTEGDYVTYLYCREGELCELYTEEGTGLTAADGVAVLPLESLAVERKGSLVQLTVTGEDGVSRSLDVAPRSGVEEGGGS